MPYNAKMIKLLHCAFTLLLTDYCNIAKALPPSTAKQNKDVDALMRGRKRGLLAPSAPISARSAVNARPTLDAIPKASTSQEVASPSRATKNGVKSPKSREAMNSIRPKDNANMLKRATTALSIARQNLKRKRAADLKNEKRRRIEPDLSSASTEVDEKPASVVEKPIETDAESVKSEPVVAPFELDDMPTFSRVQLGHSWTGKPWWFSDYPGESELLGPARRMAPAEHELFVCESCFKYFHVDHHLTEHQARCEQRQPPGELVFHQNGLSIFCVDALTSIGAKVYAQNMCLFGALFLGTKSTCFDVEPFLFYVLTQGTSLSEQRPIGFFSKERINYDHYNLACIIIFPPWQGSGYGKLLIDFSYRLSRQINEIGTPERPLSSLGLKGYVGYWMGRVVRYLRESTDPEYASMVRKGRIKNLRREWTIESQAFSIRQIAQALYLRPDDILLALQESGVLMKPALKSLLLHHGIQISDLEGTTPTPENDIAISITPQQLYDLFQKWA